MLKDEEISTYTGQVFKMYGGEFRDVMLDFRDSLLGPIHDKFGENISIIRTGPDRCLASVKVQVSPIFWRWLFKFTGEMKLLSPPDLVDEY